MKKRSIVLVMAGIVVGCGAGATVAKSWAGSSAGKWQCYQIEELPDLKEAVAEEDAKRYTWSMQRIAPNAPKGSLIQISADHQGASENYLCSKK